MASVNLLETLLWLLHVRIGGGNELEGPLDIGCEFELLALESTSYLL